MKVYNKKRPQEVPSGAVYCGRPSQWGNPFRDGTPAQNIIRFKRYAVKRHKFDPNWLRPLRDKNLVCWCAPKPCHADVLLQLANM